MRAAKVDANQPDIVNALRQMGCSVQTLHRVGGGVPDLLVGHKGANYLVEIKTSKGRLNKCQQKWHGQWKGQRCVIRSVDDVIEFVASV